MHARIMILFGK